MAASKKRSAATLVNDARGAAVLVAIAAAATIAGAWFFQLVLGIVPCPLCLEQRYAYYFIIPFAVLVAIAASRGPPRSLLALGFAVLAIAALANAGLGTYHAGVEWKFWPGPSECTSPHWRAGVFARRCAGIEQRQRAKRPTAIMAAGRFCGNKASLLWQRPSRSSCIRSGISCAPCREVPSRRPVLNIPARWRFAVFRPSFRQAPISLPGQLGWALRASAQTPSLPARAMQRSLR